MSLDQIQNPNLVEYGWTICSLAQFMKTRIIIQRESSVELDTNDA